MSDVTRILSEIERGDSSAADQLLPLVYEDLRRLAAAKLAHEKPGQTLQATALVNEVYLKLVQQRQIEAGHRTQFLAVASNTMRRILVDYARAKKRFKRGGGQQPVPLDEAEPFLTDQEADAMLALDEALERLAAVNERAGQVVQYRFYSGLSLDETADVLGISVKTVQRDWITARAWLRKEIAQGL